jgi:hypothetical protein
MSESIKGFKVPNHTANDKHPLLLLQSLSGVLDATKTQFNISLFVYKANSKAADILVTNLYQNPQNYYSFASNLSATRVRKLVDEIDKIAKQDVIKIGNPAKIMFNSEEDLLVLLGIQEPDVTATMFHENSI